MLPRPRAQPYRPDIRRVACQSPSSPRRAARSLRQGDTRPVPTRRRPADDPPTTRRRPAMTRRSNPRSIRRSIRRTVLAPARTMAPVLAPVVASVLALTLCPLLRSGAIRAQTGAAAGATARSTGGTAVGGQPGRQLVFVENTNSGDLSVIDDARLRVVGTSPVGLSPDDIIASPDDRTLYVSRIVRTESGRPTGRGEVVAVDPATHAILWRAG